MVSDGPTIVEECSAFMCNRKKPLNSVRLVVILDYFFVRFACLCQKERDHLSYQFYLQLHCTNAY